jgi:asparagine synthase (glutamine-hydrolysing)
MDTLSQIHWTGWKHSSEWLTIREDVMETGFSVQVANGHCDILLRTRPASEHLIRIAKDTRATLVLCGRLYYKGDLCKRLGQSNRVVESDAALALRWYHSAGPEGFNQLEGDYALAVWNGEKQRLVLARDPLGGFPLYYRVTPDGFVADTSLSHLRPRDAIPDRAYLADCLIVGGSVSEVATERTAWSGTQRVRPGTAIVWDGHAPSMVRFWSWSECAPRLPTHDLGELSAELRCRLTNAVRERLAETTACHVSGGLDSTAVAYLAADHLAAANQPLHAISVVYDSLGTLQTERPYVNEALRFRHGLVPHLIYGDGLLDFDGFADAPEFDEPYPGLWRLPMDRATLDAARSAGANVLMTGVGGDELFEAFPYHLADLIRCGRMITAWREAVKWARHMQLNAWDLLYPFGVANAWPVWSRLGWGMRLYPSGDLSQENEWALPDWLLPSFSRRFHFRDRVAAGLREHYTRCRPTPLSMAIWSIERRVGNTIMWSVGVDEGLMVVHPILDPRVILLGLGICATMTPEPGGQKPLLRRAIADLLPPSIMHRRMKGHFNELFYRGLARNLPRLERLVLSPAVASLEMIDPPRFLATLKKAALGALGVRPLHFAVTALTILHWVSLALHEEAPRD